MNHKTIEKMEAALNAGKHVNIDPDGSITVSDTKPHPTIDQLDATIGSEEHNRANLHPTPEEMAKLLIGFCFDHSVFTYKKHCEKCSIKAITEAIQSAQRPLQQALEQSQKDMFSEQERRVAAQEAITSHWEPRIEKLEKGEDAFLESIYKQLCQLCHMEYPLEYKGRGVWIHTGHTSCNALELRNAVENLRFTRQALNPKSAALKGTEESP